MDTNVGSRLGVDWASEANARRLKKRYAANRRLQFYGLTAIALAIGLLGTLVSSLVVEGYKAFYQSKATLEIRLDPADIDPKNLADANYRRIFNTAIERYVPEAKTPAEKRQLSDIFSSEARYALRDYVLAHPEQIGQTIKLKVSLSDPFDQLEKGVIPRYVDALSSSETSRFEALAGRGLIEGRGADAAMKVSLSIDPQKVSSADIGAGRFRDIIADGLLATLGNPNAVGAAWPMLRDDVADVLKAYVIAHPDSIGQRLENFKLPLSPNYAALASGETPKVFNQRFASEKQFEWLDRLKAQGALSYPFASELLLNPTSRFPELAGLAGAIVGSFYALVVCFLISFPLGIAAAVYLEEFARRNRWTDLIEVNINNLAAVPSVVFGLLGLAVFLNSFGLPRSAPLVGGMVLALITLPTIIITTRAALKAVPPSVREAALGIGASKHQVVMHHVLPLAMPGIMTGVIIGLAHALGETAPLLLIGMNAFIPSIENIGLLEPATALPTQIYAWADSPERGFVARTSAAILVLLAFLVVMNGIAIFLRQRFERKW
ncbi:MULTISPECIES: phosphate ABC transporter permease PstA [Rhodomicrobium]|uniref:phosphate ABC transporter permease PstA n=1 Tax=Rhodomicrobium TaxID=1068 RepID=UPI001483B657|nr:MULTISPECIES: phosphate ABC transporter permease PstA [Rhodomicrobium]